MWRVYKFESSGIFPFLAPFPSANATAILPRSQVQLSIKLVRVHQLLQINLGKYGFADF